jgi:16S rRNA (cytosine1402-N4)-methyltransferase
MDDEVRDGGHRPVLLQEVIRYLRPVPGSVVIDATLGGGGYARALRDRITPAGTLLAIDRDAQAVARGRSSLPTPDVRVVIAQGDFRDLGAIVAEHTIPAPIAVIFDLGLSSLQLDDPDRGFSFRFPEAPLDMRFDQRQPLTAERVLHESRPEELRRILREYGQEAWAGRIVERIVARRRQERLRSVGQLTELVAGAIPRARWPRNIHVATRTFQALRMAVNDELNALQAGLDTAIELSPSGGRVGVVTFHSLEDKIAKVTFHVAATDCVCPAPAPICICGHRASVVPVTRKPQRPSTAEIEGNPRARSAKLRVVEKR